MTAFSTLLSVVMLPLNLMLYSKFTFEAHIVESLDFISLFIALLVVILAIGLGILSSAYIKSYKFNLFANKVRRAQLSTSCQTFIKISLPHVISSFKFSSGMFLVLFLLYFLCTCPTLVKSQECGEDRGSFI